MDASGSKPNGPDHVIAGFARDALSPALAAIHRAGFGPQARVIDGARGDVGKQIERLGLRIPWDQPPDSEVVLIVVTAPGRISVVEEVFTRLGAAFVVYAEKPAAGRVGVDTVMSLLPDIRIVEDSGQQVDA